MTKKDLKKYTVIQDCIDGIYTIPQSAKLLGLSDRQIQRLKKEVKEKGSTGVIHKNRGKKPNNATEQDKINKIIELKKVIYMKKLILHILKNYYKNVKILIYLIHAYIRIYVKMELKALESIKKKSYIIEGKGNPILEN